MSDSVKPKRIRPPHHPRKTARSLSLRAASFKESVPGRSEFPQRGKSAPTSTKVRNRAQAAMLRSGDQLLMSIASRR